MNENDKILIAKYITKQATEEEIVMFKYLIRTSKELEEAYAGMYEAWQKSVYYNLDSIDSNKAYSEFLKYKMKAKLNQAHAINWTKIAIAASVLLVCIIGIYYFKVKSQKDDYIAVQHQDIKVPKGSTLQTVLSDGTKVWINAGSTLQFEQGFGQTSRTVYLSGEVYFDIAKGSVPFIVKTQHYTINDIGTIFNVKAYPDDLSFETTVIEGEVSIEGKLLIDFDKSQVVSVKEKQVLKLNYAPVRGLPQTPKNLSKVVEMKVQKISPAQFDDYTGWTEDLLVFEGKTFFEIIKIMERRYDVEIIIQDMKVRNYEYTGSFKNVDEVEKALQILKETTEIEYDINGRVIVIREN